MYFDDIAKENECIGQNLAIQEFNLATSDIKISPEGSDLLKLCHLFNHPKYALPARMLAYSQLPLYS